MEPIVAPLVEYGVARFVLPGQKESGDLHLVCCSKNNVVIAAIDGLGHGEEAAEAARAATAILRKEADEPVIAQVRLCHEGLRKGRGAVMSLSSIDPVHGMMTWIGIGNVNGLLLRPGQNGATVRDTLLLRGGVVGAQLPPLQAAVLPVTNGDTLVFATDGVRSEFTESLSRLETPQRAADRILQRYQNGTDDALVLVVRFTGICT